MTADFPVQTLAMALGIGLAVYLGLLAAGRYFKRRHNVRIGPAFLLFSLVVAVFVPVRWLGLHPPGERHLLAAMVLLGAWVGVTFLRRFVWERFFREGGRIASPRLLREVVSILLLLGAVVGVLKKVYGIAIPGLMAGSGIAAVVLGLAMQDLLGNIIAGFALHFEKPFRVGDWLEIDGQHARVVEMNWRSTRLLTNDDVTLDIPNRELARQKITNLHFPDARHAMRLTVGLEHAAAPTAVKAALLRAASGAGGVLADPPPQVFLKEFGDHAVLYEIKFWIDDQAVYNAAADAIRTNAWYELKRAGLRIPVSPSTVQLERAAARTRQTEPGAVRTILAELPIFEPLDDFERETLLNGSRSLWFGRGERIICQDEAGGSMFALVRGGATVLVDRGGGPKQVAVLRAGDCFGEMSLLTGEARTATLVAREDCETIEITKDAMKAVLLHNPALSEHLGAMLAQRQLDTEGALEGATPDPATEESRRAKYAEGFLHKVRSFFEL